MSNEVTLDLTVYDSLKKKIQELSSEKYELIKSHRAELKTLIKEGKVKVITKTRPYNFHELFNHDCTTKVEYIGFDDVKSQVEEHFKQGIFEEELEKEKREQLDKLLKTIAENEDRISVLESKIESIKKRSLWERIRNKF